VLVKAALDELAAMPVDAARAVVDEAKRLLEAQDRPWAVAGAEGSARSAGESGAWTGATARGEDDRPLTRAGAVAVTGVGRIAAAGVALIPANAPTLRQLLSPTVDEVRRAALNALLGAIASAGVAYGVARYAAPSLGAREGCDDTRRAVPALVVEREPTPAPPLPPLVTPSDEVCAPEKPDEPTKE
jgi:hypothetical protein